MTSTGKTPLNDLGTARYLGLPGGLYANGTNTTPSAHEAAGLTVALNQIYPRDVSGSPDPTNGEIVMISVGFSNGILEFSAYQSSFKPRADADPSKNPRLVLVDCAENGAGALLWADPDSRAWEYTAEYLADAGVAPPQVQVAWVKLTDKAWDFPEHTFPAHAQWTQANIETVLRHLKSKYPNVQIAFLSGRTRAYTDDPSAISPEPVAYESNFAVKWVIENRINGAGNLNYDPANGPVVAPYVVWGPYLWADGEVARSDGLTWLCADLAPDLQHPSESGARKVADQLLAFFKTDPLAIPWFLRGDVTGEPPVCTIESDNASGTAPLTVSFQANAEDPDGSVVDYAWTFGDGGYSLAANAVKGFPVPGEYPVYLTVTDNDGNTTTVSQTIEVSPAPVPAVSEWGLVLMSVLLVLGGALILNRRSRICDPL